MREGGRREGANGKKGKEGILEITQTNFLSFQMSTSRGKAVTWCAQVHREMREMQRVKFNYQHMIFPLSDKISFVLILEIYLIQEKHTVGF